MNADPTVYQEAKSQFTILFTWMNRMTGSHPIIGYQVKILGEKWAEIAARNGYSQSS